MATSVLTTTTATTIATHHLDNPLSPTTIIMKGEDTILLDHHHHHHHQHDNQSTINGNTSNHSFLSLPPEVRNQVYGYLFADVTLGVNTMHKHNNSSTTSSSSGRHRSMCRSFCSCSFPWGIVNTCRLVREETASLILGNTTLEVGAGRIEKMGLLPDWFLGLIPRAVVFDAKVLSGIGGISSSPPATAAAAAVRESLGPVSSGGKKVVGDVCGGIELVRFKALRVLEVRNISVWCHYYEESYLETAEADECMFNLAMFNLRRIGPGLIRLCEDPERVFKILLGCRFVGNSSRHETVEAIIDVDTRAILQKSRGATIRSRNAWAGFY